MRRANFLTTIRSARPSERTVGVKQTPALAKGGGRLPPNTIPTMPDVQRPLPVHVRYNGVTLAGRPLQRNERRVRAQMTVQQLLDEINAALGDGNVTPQSLVE